MSQKRKEESRDVGISKVLSYLLRHGACKEHLPLQSDGFIDLQAILEHPEMQKRHVQVSDVQRVVVNNDKKRFTLEETGIRQWKIRANQGHTLSEVKELDLKKLTKADVVNFTVVHGTYFKYWANIKTDGLKRMKRNHIHFASTDVLGPGISGFRNDTQVLIYVNVPAAMKDGIAFYRSTNNVILSAGIDGVLNTKYFLKVVDRQNGTLL